MKDPRQEHRHQHHRQIDAGLAYTFHAFFLNGVHREPEKPWDGQPQYLRGGAQYDKEHDAPTVTLRVLPERRVEAKDASSSSEIFGRTGGLCCEHSVRTLPRGRFAGNPTWNR